MGPCIRRIKAYPSTDEETRKHWPRFQQSIGISQTSTALLGIPSANKNTIKRGQGVSTSRQKV
jgi:hypothetical protein